MTARKGIGTRCLATASTVAALLAGSAFGGAGSFELDAVGAISITANGVPPQIFKDLLLLRLPTSSARCSSHSPDESTAGSSAHKNGGDLRFFVGECQRVDQQTNIW